MIATGANFAAGGNHDKWPTSDLRAAAGRVRDAVTCCSLGDERIKRISEVTADSEAEHAVSSDVQSLLSRQNHRFSIFFVLL